MTKQDVEVNVEGRKLPGVLRLPQSCLGIVVFAHGSGSSRHSPRNQFVADVLAQRGCGTLLFDLLTEAEAQDRRNVFDIPLLGKRMLGATTWLQQQSRVRDLPIGSFGASTGAAAALVAAAELGRDMAAVVSRGGRPDLAGDALLRVLCPTLLIVGSRDTAVLDLNRQAQSMMTCNTRLDVIKGATHLFEEPGTLEQAAEGAGRWFEMQFTAQELS